jgi:hypothetical protein
MKNHLQFVAKISFARQSRVTSLFTQLHSMRVWLSKKSWAEISQWGRWRLFHHWCSQSGYLKWHVNAISLPISLWPSICSSLLGIKHAAFKSPYVLIYPFAFLQDQGIHED